MRRDVQVEPFMEDHMVCVVPSGHPWADHEIAVNELQQATLVARELGSGSRRIVEQAMEKAGLEVKKMHLLMTFDSTEGLLSAVEAGLGIAFVSRWAVRHQLALGTLKLARITRNSPMKPEVPGRPELASANSTISAANLGMTLITPP